MVNQLKLIPLWIYLLTVFTLIYDYGFNQSKTVQYTLDWIYVSVLLLGNLSIIIRYFIPKERPRKKVWIFDILLLLFLGSLLLHIFRWIDIPLLTHKIWVFFAVFSIFIREFSTLNINFKKQYFNPAQLFIFSFIFIIFLGALLLKLPNATYEGITFIDALFTSTSAVCVTGLVVVDTGTYFTSFGQSIIIVLIQIGGLGIMTFTSYFSYFFRGGSTYENQLLLRDMTNTEKIAEVFSTLKKIIILTFIIEIIGAISIYFSLDEKIMGSISERMFFSVFHTVSGFCNAGFSTLTNSLYETGFQFNYSLHLILAFLFIIGGIGFPILFNAFKYIKHLVINRLLPFSRRKEALHIPWIININTRIVVITTLILIITGTGFFYWFEYNNTLAPHNGFGKVVTAFFGATTPRTAGFNSIDTSTLNFSTIMLIFFLMWVGASPASTGGGIKTSTFAIGTMNFISLAKGKDRVELYKREIADISVKRAFAIISLSLVVIGLSVFLIASFDSDIDLLSIAFESFSAYSTVGLSLGITSKLSSMSKMVIIGTMFIGRVSMLTILIAVFRKVKHMKYRYPTEELLIN
ncbi:MAG: ATPase [Vicingus serpentipes]|nr:ATPase [Vicingus serpentipes]